LSCAEEKESYGTLHFVPHQEDHPGDAEMSQIDEGLSGNDETTIYDCQWLDIMSSRTSLLSFCSYDSGMLRLMTVLYDSFLARLVLIPDYAIM
jgi:hypothetical protein